MAYVKMSQITSEPYLKEAIKYILNPQKTEKRLNVDAYMCKAENAHIYFLETLKHSSKKGKNLAHEIYQSFSPEDNIDPQSALSIGKELMEKLFPDHQYVIATHSDKAHIHNHIIFCAANYKDYHKFHCTPTTLKDIRRESDRLCRKNDLSVIRPNPKGHRKQLEIIIDETIEQANSYSEFLRLLKEKNVEIKIGEYLSLKSPEGKSFIRSKTIGSAYTEANIKKRINGEYVAPNKKRTVYCDVTIKMPQRLRLKKTIAEYMKAADSFDTFIKLMQQDYAVKSGKHLAFKHSTGKKFIRLRSLGEEYTEELLRLFFDDPAEYERRIAEIRSQRISVIESSDKTLTKYKHRRNADMEIRMLNYLHSHNIESYEKLLLHIGLLEVEYNDHKAKIGSINAQISDKKAITKAIREYWRYKPFHQRLRFITDEAEREKYRSDYSKELSRFDYAVEVMEKSKTSNGALPKSTDIKSAVDTLNDQKAELEAKLDRLYYELQHYKTLKRNADTILGIPVDEKEQRTKDRTNQKNK